MSKTETYHARVARTDRKPLPTLLKFMDYEPPARPLRVESVHRPKPAGVKVSAIESRILDVLDPDEPVSNGLVADRAGVSYSRASNGLHRLKEKGLARREEEGWTSHVNAGLG